jgi:hypothetical protein
MHNRLFAALLVLVSLAGGATLAVRPAAADGFMHQASFSGDCRPQPGGTACLVYADGYVWPVRDTITGWGRNHGDVQIAYGVHAAYAHVLGTDLVWVLAN